MLSVKDTKMISERERNELLDALKVASLVPHSPPARPPSVSPLHFFVDAARRQYFFLKQVPFAHSNKDEGVRSVKRDATDK